MDSLPPVSTTLATLPYELRREMVEHIHFPRDRKSLLALSLVSRAWCAQTQEVLYRRLDDWDWDYEPSHSAHRIIHDRHVRFLSSIINDPERLGPHVHTYAHNWFTSPFFNGFNYRLELALKALPAMKNLRHLDIVLGEGSMPLNLFANWTFQLRSLTLESDYPLGRGPLLDFLRTQPQIRHLHIFDSNLERFETDLSTLPRDVCPNLASILCIHHSIAQVMKGRPVIALTTKVDFERMDHLQRRRYNLDFGHLRYLSLKISLSSRPTKVIEIVAKDIVLLEFQLLSAKTEVSISIWYVCQ